MINSFKTKPVRLFYGVACVELSTIMIRYFNELDQLHNEHGPAVFYSNGDKTWYINGKMIKFTQNSKEKIVLEEECD